MARTETVTVLFTDLVGSTELASRLGHDDYEALRREQFAAWRAAVAKHNGTEVKTTGDGLMLCFTSAADAVACAVALQQATCPLRLGSGQASRRRHEDGGSAGRTENFLQVNKSTARPIGASGPSIRPLRGRGLLGTNGQELLKRTSNRAPRVAALPWRRIEGRPLGHNRLAFRQRKIPQSAFHNLQSRTPSSTPLTSPPPPRWSPRCPASRSTTASATR